MSDVLSIKQYTRAVSKALQRHGIDVPYAALRASLLQAQGLNPHARNASFTIAAPPALRQLAVFDATGWALLDEVYCAGFNVAIFSRPCALSSSPSWQYAACVVQPNGYLALNHDRPLVRVPHRTVLEDLLATNGLLTDQPHGSPHEWAITVNGANGFASNFLSEQLALRAIDELFLSEECALSDDDQVCLFTIAPDGAQDSGTAEYWRRDVWRTNRWPHISTAFE